MMRTIKTFLPILLSFFTIPFLWAADFYWEEPELFSSRSGKFPVSAHSDYFSALAWQETTLSAGSAFIEINFAVKVNGNEWETKGIIAGPYTFLGTEPSILSMLIDNDGRIIIAAAAGSAKMEILISGDRGKTFEKRTVDLGAENSVAPRIYVRADGGYLLFVTRGRNQAMSIYYSVSDDAVNWSPFEFFTPENSLAMNFLPAHSSIGKRDIVFFQSLTMGTESLSTFQLFFKTSDDGGKSWTQARRFTNFNDPVMQTQSAANNFDNQRPHLSRHGNNLLLVWERRFSGLSPQIYGAIINQNGGIVGKVERINNQDAYCQFPVGFFNGDTPAVVWFDNRTGINRIVLGQQGNINWENHILSPAGTDASFAKPVVSKDGAYIFWQTTARETGRIHVLAPDHSVSSPRITATNFTPSRANRSEIARVSWNIPPDTSNINGFSWEPFLTQATMR